MATKKKVKWAIDVKSGKSPSINLGNFEKLLNMRGVRKISYILVIKGKYYILSYDKRSKDAIKAWRNNRSSIMKGIKKASLRRAHS